MPDEIFIAVDGGASKTLVAIFDADGNELGSHEAGPSSLSVMGASAWQPIAAACDALAATAGIESGRLATARYGIGLAGANNATLKRLFLARAPSAASVRVVTDAFIAVLGAHGGRSGGVVTVGTGSVGYSLADDGSCWHTGGWGYPLDDQGSGAWIGHRALSTALKVLDGRLPDPPGGLSLYQEVLQNIGRSREEILDWLHQAGATDLAALAPIVFFAAGQDHDGAIELLTEAGREVDALARALDPTRHMPMVLLGGLAQPLAPYLPPALANWLRPAKASAIAGALMVARGEAPEERLPAL